MISARSIRLEYEEALLALHLGPIRHRERHRDRVWYPGVSAVTLRFPAAVLHNRSTRRVRRSRSVVPAVRGRHGLSPDARHEPVRPGEGRGAGDANDTTFAPTARHVLSSRPRDIS